MKSNRNISMGNQSIAENRVQIVSGIAEISVRNKSAHTLTEKKSKNFYFYSLVFSIDR